MSGKREERAVEEAPEKPRPEIKTPSVIPSKKLTVEALQHLNVVSSLLFSTRMTNWLTSMKDENADYLTVGEVLTRLKARVVQGLGVPDGEYVLKEK